jgi:serine/threonine protein kinase
MDEIELLNAISNQGMEPVVGDDGKPVGLPNVGDLLGKIRIDGILGNGGIGVVYRGTQTEMEVERAIKLPFPTSAKRDIERFKTEAKICAKLENPNIIHVYSVGYWKGVLPYAEMDYVKGGNLAQVIKQEPLPPPVALSVIAILCHALEYAHTQTITIDGKDYKDLVHRDIKPANVLISDQGVIKLTDFGLAKFEGVDLNHTFQGTLPGTIPYMAPEQHRAPIANMATDIYALGVTLYELLCARRPFPESGGPDGFVQLLAAKGAGRYPKLSDTINNLPVKLERIIHTCLHPDPKRRYLSYGVLKFEAITTLEEYMQMAPKDVVTLYFCNRKNFDLAVKDQKKKPAHKLLILILTGAVLAGLGVSAWIVWAPEKVPAPPPKSVVVAETPGQAEAPIVTTPSAVTPPAVKARSPVVKNSPGKQPKTVDAEIPSAIKEDEFTAAVRNLRSGNLDRSIVLLSGLSLDTMTSVRRDSAVIMLIEAYYRKGAVNDALEFASSHPVNDSKYYLLNALLFDVAGMAGDAERAYTRAIDTPEKIEKGSVYKSLLYRAKFFQRQYESDKTDSVKGKMIGAWKEFLRRGCINTPSAECEEARTIVGDE